MKKIKLVKLTEDERREIEVQYSDVGSEKFLLQDIFDKNENQTYLVLKHVSNSRKNWGDIEDMVTFTDALKKVNTKEDEVELDNDEVKLIKRVLEESVKEGSFSIPTEKLAEVYKSFCV